MESTMAGFCVIFFIFISFHSAFTYHIEAPKTLLLPTKYHIRGEIADLVTGLDQPFEAWYNEEKNKSRLDLYNGLVKNYYIAEYDDKSIEYKVHYFTTENITNKIVCDKNYVEEQPKVLPSIDKFTHTGEKTYKNKVVQVWTLLEIDTGKKTNDVIYVYRNEEEIDVPVWRELKVYNEWTGVTSKHTITLYYDYKVPNDEDLDVTKVKECKNTLIVSRRDRSSDEEDVFHGYKMKHGRKYKGDEHEMRRSIFEENLRLVMEHNKQDLGYKLTINEFSDRTDAELAYLTGARPSDPQDFGSIPFLHSEEEVNELVNYLPDEYDMRANGLISVVKNQASCGSCWAFGVTAGVEGVLARSSGGRILDLSEQSLLDCSWGYKNLGCKGGHAANSLQYITRYGMPVESDYGTYLAANGQCHLHNVSSVYRIKGYARVRPLDVNAMKVAVYQYGPVIVSIHASKTLMYYSSGVFYDKNCNFQPVNQIVAVVGYGKRNGIIYWIVKNSWGENWGQDGYILMSSKTIIVICLKMEWSLPFNSNINVILIN